MVFSHYAANALLDSLFRGQPWTIPTEQFWALFTGDPLPAAIGPEATYSGYARVLLVPSLTSFLSTQGAVGELSAGITQKVSLNEAVVFPSPGSNQTVTHWGIFDAAAGGNMLYFGRLLTPRGLVSGQPGPRFAPGDFVFGLV
jgi:hypothetical protein